MFLNSSSLSIIVVDLLQSEVLYEYLHVYEMLKRRIKIKIC